MYNSCDRIKAALRHETLDRIPMTEDFWPDTISRWYGEGLSAETDISEFLDIDAICQIIPFNDGLDSAFPMIVYENTQEYVVERNSYGVKVKYWKKKYATHVELDHEVKNREDWERVKDALYASDTRFDEKQVAFSKKVREKGYFIALKCSEPYWFSFKLLGMENFCIQLKSDPGFIEDICRSYMRFSKDMLRKTILSGIEWDALWFFSDMAYKNGPMFSPADYRRFFLSCHREISELCHSHGKFLLLHSDGNMEKLLPSIIEAGFDAIQPLEARAGNDVRLYKPAYGGKICLFGNISADVLASGNRGEIEEEVRSKVLAAKTGGGYIYHSDHAVPPTVSFDDYRFAIDCAKKYGMY